MRKEIIVKNSLSCYSEKDFVTFSHGNQHFICKQREKSVWNFNLFTIILYIGCVDCCIYGDDRNTVCLSCVDCCIYGDDRNTVYSGCVDCCIYGDYIQAVLIAVYMVIIFRLC